MTNLYIFLGTPDCGRRAILADLIRDGLTGETTVYIAEPERNADAEKPLAGLPATTLRSWKFDAENTIDLGELHDAGDNAVFLTDGEDDPVDQIEAVAVLAKRLDWHVTRVVTIVDCRFASAVSASADWFAACIHFSDVALLTNRGDVSNAWTKEFIDGYKKECFPCLFELVKKNRVDNPARVLDPTPRRMTMLFDEQDPIYDIEFDEENLPEEPFDLVAPTDPYLETTESGDRKIVIPRTGELLEAFDKIRGTSQA